MPYDTQTAARVRNHLSHFPELLVEEKKMFGGLAFMVNGKMCVNISGEKLMCRFDPDRTQEISLRCGYEKLVMKGKLYNGYCYVYPEGYEHDEDFKFWIRLCLDFNEKAKSSKK